MTETEEVSSDEAWYDAEIAPELRALAERCQKRGMSFVAAVEYNPGEHGGTYYMTKDAGISINMIRLCAMTAPNVDGYVISVRRYCKQEGIDMSSSFTLLGK